LARIAALEAEDRQLTDRVVKLEEELALARLHRFAPRSEKHVDRLFNEAEQAADEDDVRRTISPNFRSRACHRSKAGRERSAAAERCRQTCRASASSMTCPTIRRRVLAAVARCIAWARLSPSSFISR
jgi:hypothetical protein